MCLLLLWSCVAEVDSSDGVFDTGGDWQPPLPTETDETEETDPTVPVDSEDSETTTTWYEPPDTDTDTTTTTTPEPPWWDCEALPELPTEDNEMEGPQGYHDVYFDDEGHLIGQGSGGLVQATYDGDAELWLPLTDTIQGMDRLDDGDMVAIGSTSIYRITPDGSKSTMSSVPSGYGVTVGPDGMVYAGVGSTILRIDPDSGDSSEYLRLSGSESARVLVFSTDSSKAFIATIGAGNVYVVELDEELEPAGEAEVFANVPGTYQDGLAIDACDNLYIPDYTTRSFSRVSPDGDVTAFFVDAGAAYGHGVEFGSGIDGWREDAIYLPQPYDLNTVRELVIGVPSGDLVRTWR